MATLEVHSAEGVLETQPLDQKPSYVFGRNAEASDILLDHPSCSRQHAALVHHNDGRVFLIDLGSSHGTTVDDARIPANKPSHLKDGSTICFGSDVKKYVFRCEVTGEKRRKEEDESAGSAEKRPNHTVRASHILVKHKDSRRPHSWKEPVVTRTREEALAMIEAFMAEIQRGESTFADIAIRESHCSSHKRGGDLGEFGPGQMQEAFEKAAYALKVNEMSGPVFTDSGVHLILRTA